MTDQFPRPPADEEEREACENFLGDDPWCEAVYGTRPGHALACTRRVDHDAAHVAAGQSNASDPVVVLARWPDAPIVEPAAVVLRGVAWHRFADGGMSVAVAGDAYGRADGQRFLHLSPDEARGTDQGDGVTIKIEVIRE